jgi:DNA invertase Pin-like site-specific DNA recombinase
VAFRDAPRCLRAGKCFFDMLGVFAEFETNLRPNGKWRESLRRRWREVQGRKATVPVDVVRSMKAEGKGPGEIAETLGVSRMSVWRALRDVAVE